MMKRLLVCAAALWLWGTDAAQQSLLAQTGAAPSVTIRRNDEVNFESWPADVNGDGIMDLVSSGPWINQPPTLRVLLGKGDGTFGAPMEISCMCRALGVADFNRDGRVDLLVEELPEPDVSIFVLQGNGDGTFGSGSTTHMVTQASYVYFGLGADVDGDGNLDVVLGVNDEGTDLVVVVPGNGDLTFRFQSSARLVAAARPMGAVVADLNGDGQKDLAVANHDGHSISIFLNQGVLSFAPADIPLDRQANDVAAVDVNHDGKLDLLVAASHDGSDDLFYIDGFVYVLTGNGNGTFAQPVKYETASGPWRIVTGDFNRDGVPDIATANRSAKQEVDFCGFLWDTISILPGKGDGTYAAASSFSLGNQSDLADTRFHNSVRSLSTADINGDGQRDLVVSFGAILLNQPPDPNWPPTVTASATSPDANHTIMLRAIASDVDQDRLSYQWTDSSGQSIEPTATPCAFTPTTLGTHTFTVTVNDGHGHAESDSVVVDFGGGGGDAAGQINITAPAVGEVVTGGQPYTIRWTGPPASSHETLLPRYSVDGGKTWPILFDCYAIEVGAGQCVWQNPGPDSNNQALISMTTRDPDFPASGGTGPFTIRSAAGAPPWPWQHRDIGAVAAAGSATYANGVFSVRASGTDIWGTADEFHFVEQFVNGSTTGDFDLVAHVDSVQNVNAWTKAGLMVRASLTADSAHASIFMTPGKGVAFQRRKAAGGLSVNTSGPLLTAPVWLRLSVRPNRVMAFYKKNETDQWSKLGEEAFPAPSGYQFAYGGLALTSHADGTMATATFSNVAFNPWPTWSVSSIGGGVGSGSFDGSTATLANRGTDIWGTADQLTFVNTNYDGDGTLTARVQSIDNTNAWAKSGVMFRNTLLANSPHVSVFVTPGKGISMQYRSAAGGTSAQVKQLPGAAPVWLRLVRSGNMFIGAWSADATTWTTIGSITVSMPPEVRVGAAVTSHNVAASATSVLTGLSIGR